MSEALNDLLASMREHPAFPELLKSIPSADIKPYRRTPASESPEAQKDDWIFRSGRHFQHQCWVTFLTEGETSQQEKS